MSTSPLSPEALYHQSDDIVEMDTGEVNTTVTTPPEQEPSDVPHDATINKFDAASESMEIGLDLENATPAWIECKSQGRTLFFLSGALETICHFSCNDHRTID